MLHSVSDYTIFLSLTTVTVSDRAITERYICAVTWAEGHVRPHVDHDQ